MRRLSKREIKSLKKFYQKLSDYRDLVLTTKWFDEHDVCISNDFFTSLIIDNFRLNVKGGVASA